MSDANRAPRVPFALLVTALIIGGLGLLLALNTASAANELERHSLATKDQQVAAQVQQLRNEVALSAAPGNLAQAASELGMVPAGNPAFIVLGADGTAKVLGKPKAVVGVPLAIAPAPTKAKPAATKTPSATKTPAPSKTPGKAAASKTSKTSKTGKTGKTTKTLKPTKTPAPTKTPRPSTPAPTPTPTLTLPGGNR